jgi:hypothetical protein
VTAAQRRRMKAHRERVMGRPPSDTDRAVLSLMATAQRIPLSEAGLAAAQSELLRRGVAPRDVPLLRELLVEFAQLRIAIRRMGVNADAIVTAARRGEVQ